MASVWEFGGCFEDEPLDFTGHRRVWHLRAKEIVRADMQHEVAGEAIAKGLSGR
jgi:hypothetical protein